MVRRAGRTEQSLEQVGNVEAGIGQYQCEQSHLYPVFLPASPGQTWTGAGPSRPSWAGTNVPLPGRDVWRPLGLPPCRMQS